MTQERLLAYIDRRRARYGTWSEFAKHLGITKQAMYDFKQGNRKPSKLLLKELGLEPVTIYRKVK